MRVMIIFPLILLLLALLFLLVIAAVVVAVVILVRLATKDKKAELQNNKNCV